jgi:hypothetical protein
LFGLAVAPDWAPDDELPPLETTGLAVAVPFEDELEVSWANAGRAAISARAISDFFMVFLL